jgi:subtilase family serine protease
LSFVWLSYGHNGDDNIGECFLGELDQSILDSGAHDVKSAFLVIKNNNNNKEPSVMINKNNTCVPFQVNLSAEQRIAKWWLRSTR